MWVARVVRPVIAALNWIANHTLRLVGVEPKDEVASAFTAQEVQSIVERSQAEGLLDDEQGLLTGAIEFSDRTAGDVMIAPDALVTVGRGSTPEDVERLVAKTGFSRFPVRRRRRACRRGTCTSRTSCTPTRPSGRVPVPRVACPAARGRRPGGRGRGRARRHAALGFAPRRGSTTDGATVGVVFLEDILEELVGEVRDAMQREQLS